MSAPYTELPSSISSTGHEDGLGRRALSFDRETGEMLEHLYVRPDLAVYDQLIRERVARLATLEDERIGRPSRVERDPHTGELAVVSGFVSGHRISDLLETSQEAAVAPGVDVALGYLLDALPALSALHTASGFAHGLIDPGRSVLTPTGRVVLLDAVFGAAVQRLGLSHRRLWTTFGIAAPSSATTLLDAPLDVSQTALSAVMLVLGRKLRADEYPEAIPSLLMEVVDVAQIRGSTGFAGGLQRILQRSLPLPGRRAYATADEIILDVRQLVRREIGMEVCRRALRDFVEQMDTAISPSAAAPFEPGSGTGPSEEEDLTDEILEHQDEDRGDLRAPEISHAPETLSDPLEFEIRLESEDSDHVHDLSSLRFGESASAGSTLSEPAGAGDSFSNGAHSTSWETRAEVPGETPDAAFTPQPFGGDPTLELAASETSTRYDSDSASARAERSRFEPPAQSRRDETYTRDIFERSEEPLAQTGIDAESTSHHAAREPLQPFAETPPESALARGAAREGPGITFTSEMLKPDALDHDPIEEFRSVSVEAEPAATITHASEAPQEARSAPSLIPVVGDTHGDAGGADGPAPGSEAEQQADDSHELGSRHSRRKRHQQKSARARKDKLRSTAVSQPTVSQPSAAQQPAQPKTQASKSGWLVPPERAAAFEQHAQPPAPVQQPVMAAAPPPAPVIPQPSFGVPQVPAYPTPAPIHQHAVPQQPFQPQPPPVQMPHAPRHGPAAAGGSPMSVSPVASSPVVKLKVEPPAGYEPPKKRRVPHPPMGGPLEPVTPLPYAQRGPMFATEEPRGFPWKLVFAILVIVGVGIVGGRAYLASHAAKDPVAGTTVGPPVTPEPEPAPTLPPSKNGGQIVVQTQPAGAKVLLDGKAAGESPVTLNGVAPGKHVVTLVSSSGTVKQTVRVGAGKSVTIDLPIFSGWLAVFAPVVLDVAEGGKSVGSTEQSRLMLAPGHHSLTLSNRELGYTAVQEVDVSAGEVTSITINPVGAVNFNALPWAEVWVDGHKIGETPIANMMLPLGEREFVFKNSQFGDRRVTATIRADRPAAVSVDFSKEP